MDAWTCLAFLASEWMIEHLYRMKWFCISEKKGILSKHYPKKCVCTYLLLFLLSVPSAFPIFFLVVHNILNVQMKKFFTNMDMSMIESFFDQVLDTKNFQKFWREISSTYISMQICYDKIGSKAQFNFVAFRFLSPPPLQ